LLRLSEPADEAQIHELKDGPLIFTTALAAWLSSRRICQLPFGARWL
jgi:hypothetical protein